MLQRGVVRLHRELPFKQFKAVGGLLPPSKAVSTVHSDTPELSNKLENRARRSELSVDAISKTSRLKRTSSPCIIAHFPGMGKKMLAGRMSDRFHLIQLLFIIIIMIIMIGSIWLAALNNLHSDIIDIILILVFVLPLLDIVDDAGESDAPETPRAVRDMHGLDNWSHVVIKVFRAGPVLTEIFGGLFHPVLMRVSVYFRRRGGLAAKLSRRIDIRRFLDRR